MTHQPGNEICLVAHYDMQGRMLEQCTRCIRCGRFLRPEEFVQECAVPKEALETDELERLYRRSQ